MMKRQKVKNDVVYKKLEKRSDSEEETELLVRHKASRKETPTIEKVLEEGDTLQSLAIQHRCTIEELKRLNNIHKENEIFARRTIKVPHHPLSMALAEVHTSGRSSPQETIKTQTKDLNVEIANTLINLSNAAESSELNTIIFNSNIAKIRPAVDDDVENLQDEHVHLLPQKDNEMETISRFTCSGVDGDISLKALIVCVVIVIFAVPLIYVLYIAEHPEQYHHQHVS